MARLVLNGLGRIGKLALRPLLERGLTPRWLNDAAGDPAMHAHRLEFDTVHGRWPARFEHDDRAIGIDGTWLPVHRERNPAELPLDGIDVVIDRTCTGQVRNRAALAACFFELERATTVDEVNGLFEAAAAGALEGILGYETRPLVSTDFTNDTRSAIVDAPSTMVVNETQVKVYAWYDNEMGYAHRLVDIVDLVVGAR